MPFKAMKSLESIIILDACGNLQLACCLNNKPTTTLMNNKTNQMNEQLKENNHLNNSYYELTESRRTKEADRSSKRECIIPFTCLILIVVIILTGTVGDFCTCNQTSPRLGHHVTALETGSHSNKLHSKRSLVYHQHQQQQQQAGRNNVTTAGSRPQKLCLSGSNAQFEPDSFNHSSNESINGQWHYESNQNQSFGYSQARISNFVKPSFYTLRLKVDPTKRKFTGQLMITLDVVAPSAKQAPSVDSIDEVLEHSRGLYKEINRSNDGGRGSAVMRDKNGEIGHRYLTLNAGSSLHIKKAFYVFKSPGSIQIPATKIGRNLESELLTLDFYPNVLTSGQGLLLIVYAGVVNETDSQGLFVHHSLRGSKRSLANMNANNQKASLSLDDSGLATHMQPNFARRLFPSWDEPHLKARFNLIVILPFRGYQSISNMPIKQKSISLSCSGESLQEIEFHTTPTMSTYLLTLIIGRFDHIDSITANNCKISAYVYSNQSGAGAGAGDLLSTQPEVDKTPPMNSRRQAAQMALDVAVRSFDIFETILGVKYPLQKFDLIALREFNSGGMENWGASIFHENYLLYDNSSSSQQDVQVNGGRQRPKRLVVPLVVAHEIAHQWFGNLLTSYSWTYLWLNEGFAQLFMYQMANWLYPHENYWHIFIEDSRQSAMHEDELITSSHALEYELYPSIQNDGPNSTSSSQLEMPTDQLSLFDQLTYNKGAMIVLMVQSLLLGDEQFFAGLRHYLLKHSYDTVTSSDLWLALEESSTDRANLQLDTIMEAWLRQEGFPLISVQVFDDSATNYKLRLTQERFSLMKLPETIQSSLSINTSSTIWSVPISISSEMNPILSPNELKLNGETLTQLGRRGLRQKLSSSSFLFNEKAATILLPKSQIGSWFKLNHNATGYYRVDYQVPLRSDGSLDRDQLKNQVDLLDRMMEPARSKSMCVIDRFNLIDDLFAMVKSGMKPSAYYLRYLIEAFDEETEIIVLRSIVESLKRIKSAIVSNSDSSKLHSLFDRYVQEYLRKVSRTLRSKLDTETTTMSNSTFARANNNNNNNNQQQLRETLDLIDVSGIVLSSNQNSEFVEKAVDLFTRNFRHWSPGSSRATTSTPTSALASTQLDAMDREMRASIYLGALIGANDVDLAPDFSLNDELPALRGPNAAAGSVQMASSSSSVSSSGFGGSQPAQAYVTNGRDPILSSYSSLSSIFTSQANGQQQQQQQQLQSSQSDSAPTTATTPAHLEGDTFLRLLRAYETSDSSGQRFAICTALGSVSLPSKQLKLLNLTLFDNYFRLSDAPLIVDSMARSRTGRDLIWQALRGQNKVLERRQLLGVALKSLSQGLIESTSASNDDLSIENFLRSLYHTRGEDYAKLISQTIEYVRINTRWFKQDHDGLLQYLTGRYSSTIDE